MKVSPMTWLRRFDTIDWSRYLDRDLLLALLALVGIGVVMLGSASLWVAEREYGDAYYYLSRQVIFLVVGTVISVLVYQLRMAFWERLGVRLLPLVVFLLVLVLIPGIGHEVNGSRRWLNLGFMTLQVSELVKIIMVLYLAGYLVRHGERLSQSNSYQPLIIPLAILGLIGGLLILEPDFGAMVIVTVVGLSMLFLGGVAMKRLLMLFSGAVAVMIPLAMMGYRGDRLEAYWNPWAYETGKGYQTVHALMAIGDGGWFGNGLGAGVQKLFYLPEAHNDFIFSVLAEEFGFIGMLVMLILFAWVVYRAFAIGFQADKQGLYFGAYVAYGIGFWLGLQVILHVGVNLAVLPPKGLTLPLISYGGSSLVTTMIAMALLMRVYRDTQINLFGLSSNELKRHQARTASAAARTQKAARSGRQAHV